MCVVYDAAVCLFELRLGGGRSSSSACMQHKTEALVFDRPRLGRLGDGRQNDNSSGTVINGLCKVCHSPGSVSLLAIGV
jgi:hypothetical protein